MSYSLHPTPRIWEQPANLLLLIKAGQQSSFHMQGGEDRSSEAHHSIPTGLQVQGPPLLGSHPTNPALGQPRKKGGFGRAQTLARHLTASDHKHMAGPTLGLRFLPKKQGLRLWCSEVPDIPDRIAGTRSLKDWQVCSKGAPSPGCLRQSCPSLRILPPSSPAQSCPTVTPTSHITGMMLVVRRDLPALTLPHHVPPGLRFPHDPFIHSSNPLRCEILSVLGIYADLTLVVKSPLYPIPEAESLSSKSPFCLPWFSSHPKPRP